MKEGLFLLWLLAVGISAVAWIYLEISRAGQNRLQSRRQITGCELARQILDGFQLNRTAVVALSGQRKDSLSSAVDQLFLSGKVYYGTRLVDLTSALYEAIRHSRISKMVIGSNPRTPPGRFIRRGVVLSWLLVIGGALMPAWSWMTYLGQLFLVAVFFVALAFLPGEWEVADQALSHLTLMEGLGTDEKVRMRHLLKTIRWAPLTEILRIPFSLFRSKMKVPSGV